MVTAMHGQRVVIDVQLLLSPLVNGMNLAPRVVPAILDQRPNDNDVITSLRHAKRIMKCLARCLGKLQRHRVCTDNLHHEGAVPILTVAVIQNVLKSRMCSKAGSSVSRMWVSPSLGRPMWSTVPLTVKHGAMIFRRSGWYT